MCNRSVSFILQDVGDVVQLNESFERRVVLFLRWSITKITALAVVIVRRVYGHTQRALESSKDGGIVRCGESSYHGHNMRRCRAIVCSLMLMLCPSSVENSIFP